MVCVGSLASAQHHYSVSAPGYTSSFSLGSHAAVKHAPAPVYAAADPAYAAAAPAPVYAPAPKYDPAPVYTPAPTPAPTYAPATEVSTTEAVTVEATTSEPKYSLPTQKYASSNSYFAEVPSYTESKTAKRNVNRFVHNPSYTARFNSYSPAVPAQSYTPYQASNAPKPIAHVLKPTAYVPKPAAFVHQPTVYAPKPTVYAPKPTVYAPKPYAPKPVAAYDPKPLSHTQAQSYAPAQGRSVASYATQSGRSIESYLTHGKSVQNPSYGAYSHHRNTGYDYVPVYPPPVAQAEIIQQRNVQFPERTFSPSDITHGGAALYESRRLPQIPSIASLYPETDKKGYQIDGNTFAVEVFKFPIAITNAIQATRGDDSPNAAAAIAYIKTIGSEDICGRATQLYLEVILNGGSVDEANSAATRIYIDDFNRGLYSAPGSACEASDIAWRKAVSEGSDPVVASAIAFMDNWPGTKEGNPCAVSGREYVNAIINGASHTQATRYSVTSFAAAIKKLADQGKELRDPACAAATRAFFDALPQKPSPPNAAAMMAFLDKAFDGFSFIYDPVCWRSTEAFFDSYAKGNSELVSNQLAAETFLEEFAKGGAGIPADSPCAAATRAYYANIPNPPSPPNKAAMEAFMDKMISGGKREADPACALSTSAYL